MRNLKYAAALLSFSLALNTSQAQATTYTVTTGTDMTTDVAAAQNGDTLNFTATPISNATSYTINSTQTWADTGTINLSNALALNGTGTISLSGDNFAFNGGLTVNSGTLSIMNSPYAAIVAGAPFVLGANATLNGVGSVNLNGGGVTATVNGTIAPGTSATPTGTLNMAGTTADTVTFGPTAKLSLTASGVGIGKLAIYNNAVINGLAITLNGSGTGLTVNQNYTVLTFSGNTTTVNVAPTLTDPTSSVGRFSLGGNTGSGYYLTYLGPNGTQLAPISLSTNERNVGTVIDHLSATGSSSLFTSLESQTTAQQQQSLDQLNGSIGVNLQTTSAATSRLALSAMQSRLAGGVSGGGGTEVALVDNDGAFQVADADSSFWGPAGKIPARLTAWVQGFGEFDSISGNGAAAGITSTIGGGAVGIENHFDGDDKVGVSFGAATDSFSLHNVAQSGTQNTFTLGLYGSKGVDVALSNIGIEDDTARHLVFDGAVLASYNSASEDRTISATGEYAHGTTDGFGFGANGGVGYPIDLPEGSVLTPRVGLTYTYSYENGYTETGAPVGGLSVNSSGQNLLQSSVGVTIKHKFELPDWRDSGSVRADAITPEVHAAWTHDILDPRASAAESFSGLAGSSFTSYGAAPDRDAAAIGIGASYVPGDATQVSIYGRYDAVLSGNQTDNMVTGGLKYNW
jgi:uncharacterized protein with beta-barrel porin domain